ncbi:hypothetical protein YC2023_040462 [Brassica napus]
MSLCTSNLHPSSSSTNLFSNNNNSPKPSLNSLWFFTSTSPSSSVAPLSFSTTNHALCTNFVSVTAEERGIVLVIGTGGREHALCHALKRSPSCNYVLCTPGNPGIPSSGDATCVPDLDVSDSSACLKETENSECRGGSSTLKTLEEKQKFGNTGLYRLS